MAPPHAALGLLHFQLLSLFCTLGIANLLTAFCSGYCIWPRHPLPLHLAAIISRTLTAYPPCSGCPLSLFTQFPSSFSSWPQPARSLLSTWSPDQPSKALLICPWTSLLLRPINQSSV
ncbi:hypothetical protein GOP47_0017985 [Adiantum capillus-veneris]|uniref:Uncharacterized protein n=1 Tax=Adiantum capillus-veneris TaxID=13818 RepID=A0A9D4UGX5_ADICA|nr:hypothetical protein GOP47_0017985 [Adiantum capillus-veneris]